MYIRHQIFQELIGTHSSLQLFHIEIFNLASKNQYSFARFDTKIGGETGAENVAMREQILSNAMFSILTTNYVNLTSRQRQARFTILCLSSDPL